MSRTAIYFIFCVIILVFLSAVIYGIQYNMRLEREREELILKNDSLHTLQLRTKKELAYTRARLDSILAAQHKR